MSTKGNGKWVMLTALSWAGGAVSGYALAYVVGNEEPDLKAIGCGPILAISLCAAAIQWRYLARERHPAAGLWLVTGIVVGSLVAAFWVGASEWVQAASPPTSEIDSEVAVLFLMIVTVTLTGGVWGILEGVRSGLARRELVSP
jgi:hypothetical protein